VDIWRQTQPNSQPFPFAVWHFGAHPHNPPESVWLAVKFSPSAAGQAAGRESARSHSLDMGIQTQYKIKSRKVFNVGVSAVLANETRSLIAREAVAGPIIEELHRALAADSRIIQIDEIATMHLGPQAILMALTLRFRSDLSIPAMDDAIREITFALQAVEKRVAYVYIRPGPNGALPLG
jgi:hypothetical protein